MNLKNKRVLVTGASSGIGQAVAIAFAERGATVLINYRSNKKGAEETLKAVEKHSTGRTYKADLMKDADIAKMFRAIKKDVGGVDILVNNAGDAGYGSLFDQKTWQYQYESILMTTVRTTRGFLKLKSGSQRRIVNITSFYGNLPTANPDLFAYSVMKGALNTFTATLAKSLGKKVLVNAVAPGWTWTPAWNGTSKAEKRAHEKATVIGRFIEPKEIAQAAVALAENDAITGQVLVVDGGAGLVRMP
ncbi:SDR family oxidoreductase [Patescibacteria group bacterium]|nr:SDR family oxidoreductase [Patescibacteria group bacterium]